MDLDTQLLDDDLWERLLELTNGAAALCYQCGECTAACPWGLVQEKSIPVRSLMRKAQLGIEHISSDLWLCTTCAQCQSTCPRGVDIPAVFLALRQIAWEQKTVEKGLPSVLWSMYWNSNPWSQPPSHRADWARNLNIPLFDPAQHETLLYVGCTSSYNRRAQKTARALVKLLNAAGVPFGYLRDEEPCCGETALSLGNLGYFEEIASNSIRVFKEKGVKKILTISPHCYDTFKNHYPNMPSDWQPIHATQFLADLIQQKRLEFKNTHEWLVTFQDPCYLGRKNNEYEAPRNVLTAIPGIKVMEMENSHQDGLCCGGGGGRMWLETPVGERFSDLRIQQAARTGADFLVTACPFCLSCLEDSVKLANLEKIEVLDLAELAELALGS